MKYLPATKASTAAIAPPVALRQACSRPRRLSGITLDIRRLNTTRWAPMKTPNMKMKNSSAATSGGPLSTQPDTAIMNTAARPRLPIQKAIGITLVRCSTCAPVKIGEMIPPTCCSASARPTTALEPET